MSTLNNKTGCVFDAFGTLIYIGNLETTYRNQYEIYTGFLSELGINDHRRIREVKNLLLTQNFESLHKVAEELERLYGIGIKGKDIQTYQDRIDTDVSNARKFRDVERNLAILRDSGYRLGLISNASTPYKRPFFDLKLDKYIDKDNCIFSCDVGLKKPDPKIFEMMTGKFGLPSRNITMIGNTKNWDYKGALDAGMKAILLVRDGTHGSLKGINHIRGLKDIHLKMR